MDKSITFQKAFELGKADATKFNKYDPEKAMIWETQIDAITQSGLKKEFEISYRKGYFAIVNERNRQKQSDQRPQTTQQKVKEVSPKDQIQIVDRTIEELQKKKLLIKSKNQSKQNDTEPEI